MQRFTELHFKFRFVKNGQPANLFAKKGYANETELILNGDPVPLSSVVDTTTRDNRLAMVFAEGTPLGPAISGGSEAGATVIETYKVKALDLERFIDRAASAAEVETTRKALEAEGNSQLFRTASCPHCQATINLSRMDSTQYVYCRFCETVFSERKVTAGDQYKICEGCGFFDRVRGYTEFYFYFLLIIYGFSYKRRHLCDNCAGSLFWKVLLVNLIFILGVPSAVWLKIKSMTGRDPEFADLAKANHLAQKGQAALAEPLYANLQDKLPEHPGLLYNRALGKLSGQDTNGAMGDFRRSMRACSNYLPTIRLLENLKAPDSQEQ